MLILPHVKIYLGKFQLNFQLHMKERRFVFEYEFGFKYIYILNDFQHWCTEIYQRQVCRSDIVQIMHWKSTRSFGETLCVFLCF